MEKVYFSNSQPLFETAKQAFSIHKHNIKNLLPQADVQHVGSTAIPNCLTKGELDIQVRVKAKYFPEAVKLLSTIYEENIGSITTESFRAFKDDSANPPLGIQLTVIDSEHDFFWKFRDVLLLNESYRQKYDELKKKYNGKEMDRYREAKNEFFQKIMDSSEYKSFK